MPRNTIKKIAAKTREGIAFRTEKDPDRFGMTRKEWDAARKADRARKGP